MILSQGNCHQLHRLILSNYEISPPKTFVRLFTSFIHEENCWVLCWISSVQNDSGRDIMSVRCLPKSQGKQHEGRTSDATRAHGFWKSPWHLKYWPWCGRHRRGVDSECRGGDVCRKPLKFHEVRCLALLSSIFKYSSSMKSVTRVPLSVHLA